jgi:hypothetical protein
MFIKLTKSDIYGYSAQGEVWLNRNNIESLTRRGKITTVRMTGSTASENTIETGWNQGGGLYRVLETPEEIDRICRQT